MDLSVSVTMDLPVRVTMDLSVALVWTLATEKSSLGSSGCTEDGCRSGLSQLALGTCSGGPVAVQ